MVNVAVAITVPTIYRMSPGDLGPQLGEAGLELLGRSVVALLDALADGVGDDFRLVTVAGGGGDLLRDGERVEYAGSLSRPARGGDKRSRPTGRFRPTSMRGFAGLVTDSLRT